MPPRPAPSQPRELPRPPQSALAPPRPLPTAPQPRSLPHSSTTGTPSPSLIPAPHSSRTHTPRPMGTSASSLTRSSSSDAITPQKRMHPNSTRNLVKGRGRAAPPVSPQARIAAEAAGMDLGLLELGLNDERNAAPRVAREAGTQQIQPIQREGMDSVNRDWEMYRQQLRSEPLAAVRPFAHQLWIVTGWDPVREVMKVGTWHHLSKEGSVVQCDCNEGECVHTRLFTHDRSLFKIPPDEDGVDFALPLDPEVALVFRRSHGYRFFYSVSKGQGSHASRKRTFVAQLPGGRWKCFGCGGNSGCTHSALAKDYGMLYDGVEEDGHSDGEDEPDDEPNPPHDATEEKPIVSNKKRGPSLASRFDPIPGDPNPPSIVQHDALYPTYPSPHLLPPLLPMDSGGRCPKCFTTIDEVGAATEGEVNKYGAPFIVFGECQAHTVEIELVKCPTCTSGHYSIGPDLLELGLVNINNRYGFAREALDLFEAHLVHSETPFNAFREATSIAYRNRRSLAFPTSDYFRTAWYAWARLRQIDSKMICPICGPNPKMLVADGTVTSTPVKFATGRLQPPTATPAGSTLRPGVESVANRCIIPAMLGLRDTRSLRKLFASLETWARNHSATISLPSAIEDVLDQTQVSPFSHAFRAFINYYRGIGTGNLRMSLRKFLRQIISEDIILQVFPPRAAPLLRNFLQHPEFFPSEELCRLMPVLGEIATALDQSRRVSFPPEVLALLELLHHRSTEFLDQLITNHKKDAVVSQDPPALAKKDDWQTTGVISGGDQLRGRAIFPKLARDGGFDRGKEEASCRKLYSLSSKSGLTGGISAIWCTHKICYVAHTMFNAEGRNDIFAAAYCYLPDPPDIFVYDYACQLATYSLVREPEHFKHTRFYVDELHAHGHTKCSSAFFLAQAIKQDPNLRHLNSSAAECAHSTIGRIRKSMRYMTEAHGILLMNTMMHLWNRKMLDKLLEGRVVKVV